ncbi:hypothetical protein BH10PSE17_BH10PSE17_11720 [soil metagenome]
MKIVHLLVDDKFIDSAIREFEIVSPNLHEYLIVAGPAPFRYLRSARIRRVSQAEWATRMAQPDVAAVVLHSLPANHYALVSRIPSRIQVIWLGWGYDYYGLINDAFPQGLLLAATTSAAATLSERSPVPVRGALRSSDLSVARHYAKPSRDDRAALARVDWFSPVLDDEYRLVRLHQPWFGARHLEWNYLTLEDDLVIDASAAGRLGPNLLIGNSATTTNNHLEVFEHVRERIDLDGRQLIVPLSYGDMRYADLIARTGQRMFGEAFVPLRDFIAKERYLALLNSCGIVVMNHIRQQALGNIMIGGLMGARIFLNRANPLMRWLEKRGVQVDDIDALQVQPLDEGQRADNVRAITSFAGRSYRRALSSALVRTALAQR